MSIIAINERLERAVEALQRHRRVAHARILRAPDVVGNAAPAPPQERIRAFPDRDSARRISRKPVASSRLRRSPRVFRRGAPPVYLP